MHHFGITFSIATIEEIQHFLLELFTIFLDVFPSLRGHFISAARWI